MKKSLLQISTEKKHSHTHSLNQWKYGEQICQSKHVDQNPQKYDTLAEKKMHRAQG